MRRVHLTQFLIERQRDKKLINADLRLLIETIARACKAISTRVNKGALGDGLGGAATRNVHGEVQKKLDVLSNEILLEANEWGGNLAALASEEMENPRPIPTQYPRGEYLLLFDPLDGSSNIDECLAGSDGPRGKDFNMRWVASMVADVFRVLSRGGIFMYPRDSKNKDGRLRLMYEANPMALIVEQAGGAATDGRTPILDLQPKGLHQRVAVILGSRNEVERVTSYHK